MELTWSTFVLEIINFLVLVWILKRFLYKPVLDVIAERRRKVQEQLDQAHETEAAALELKEKYTSRLQNWEAERREARETLAREIEQERAHRLSEVELALEREREKARVAEGRQNAEQERALEQQALQQGAEFSSRLLGQAAGPELEARLVNMLLDDLASLPDERRMPLRDQWPDQPKVVDVSSAFDLSDEQRERLTSALRDLAGVADIRFRRDETLVAGLRIEIGAWVLAINVRDELKGFAELASVPR